MRSCLCGHDLNSGTIYKGLNLQALSFRLFLFLFPFGTQLVTLLKVDICQHSLSLIIALCLLNSYNSIFTAKVPRTVVFFFFFFMPPVLALLSVLFSTSYNDRSIFLICFIFKSQILAEERSIARDN